VTGDPTPGQPGSAPSPTFFSAWVKPLFRRVTSLGFAPEDTDEEKTQKSILSLMSFFGFWAALFMGIHDVVTRLPTKGILMFVYAALTVLGFIHFSRTKNFPFFRFCQLFLILILPFLGQFLHGGFSRAGASMIWALGCPFGAALVYSSRQATAWFLGFLSLLALSGLLENRVTALPLFARYHAIPLFYVFHIGGIAIVLFIIVQYFVYRLRQEQDRSEKLLLNVLPSSIAQRLKREGETIAEGFAQVTILFADLVGFTTLSASREPEEIVRVLNRVFSEFDLLTEKFGLEKIKTIGDCYMAVCGLPQPRVDHAQAVADFAREMQNRLQELNQKLGIELHVRIGINSGPVVAGVIGLRKFIYDLWGDTVNVASRMESAGIPDEIQVSESTYLLLKDGFVLKERGLIDIKGKGQMRTFLLRERRSLPVGI
jgi:guanylate cyclase